MWHAGLHRMQAGMPQLVGDDGKWTARNDVTYTDPRLFPTRASSPLPATSNNGKSIGPELGFGSVIGTFHDEQVLIIKTAMGNRSLKFDFRPPSSGRTDPGNKFESYALYVNGKLLTENREGVTARRRQGGLPRGVAITPEFRALFQSGKVTIAVGNFAMENFSVDRFIPPGLPLNVWIEEQNIPLQLSIVSK